MGRGDGVASERLKVLRRCEENPLHPHTFVVRHGPEEAPPQDGQALLSSAQCPLARRRSQLSCCSISGPLLQACKRGPPS